MAKNDEPIGYVAFRRDGKGKIQAFAVIPNREKLEKWKSRVDLSPEELRYTSESGEVIHNEEDTKNDLSDRAIDLLNRIRKTMTSIHNMIEFTSPTSSFLTALFIEQKILVHSRKNLQIEEDSKECLVYSFFLGDFPAIKRLMDTFLEARDGHDALPGATLLSLVATFDSYFSEIVKFFLAIHPERYTESERQISLCEVFTRKSLGDVINRVIDLEIGELMRGSHTEQVKFVETHLGIKIIDHYERWPNFVEIFERINLVATVI